MKMRPSISDLDIHRRHTTREPADKPSAQLVAAQILPVEAPIETDMTTIRMFLETTLLAWSYAMTRALGVQHDRLPIPTSSSLRLPRRLPVVRCPSRRVLLRTSTLFAAHPPPSAARLQAEARNRANGSRSPR
jgi:hypothetical protein